jgi:hypothetical protein
MDILEHFLYVTLSLGSQFVKIYGRLIQTLARLSYAKNCHDILEN